MAKSFDKKGHVYYNTIKGRHDHSEADGFVNPIQDRAF